MGGATSLRPPPLPREHGAWVMLAIPLLLGLAAAGRPRAAALLLVPAMALLFLARYAAISAAARVLEGKASPPGYLARRALWSGIYAAGAAAGLAAAAVLAPPAARAAALGVGAVALLLGVSHTVLALRRRDRTLAGEVVGMAGLAAGAPLAVALAGRPVDGGAAGLAILSLAYFVSTAVFVRTFERLGEDRGLAIAACLAAHLALAGLIASVWAAGWLTGGAALAFLPVLARAAWGLASPPRNVRLLGRREAGVAAAFAVIAVAGLLL